MNATATQAPAVFTLNSDAVLRDIEGVKGALDDVLQAVTKEMTQATRDFAALVIFEAQQRVPKRSEDLKNSAIIEDPRQDDEGVFTKAGFDKIYAHVQDAEKTTIKPVRADALTIPQRAILDSNGKSKFANPRQEPDLFPVKLWGEGFLAKRVGKKLELHWKFAKEVTIYGNRYFSGVIEEQKSAMPEFFGVRVKGQLTGGSLR